MPNSFPRKSSSVIKLQRAALEVTHKSDSGVPDVTSVPVVLALLMMNELVEGNRIEFEVR